MKLYVKNLEGCFKLVQVQADPQQVAQTRESVGGDFARKARLPGYRPGKAPRDLVVHQFAKQIEEELLKRLIEESIHQAIGELKLPVVQVQEIQEVSFKDDRLSFKAKVEVRPEVSLRRYRGIKVSRRKAQVQPEEVGQVLRSLQEEHAQLIPKEGAVEEGDFVVCDLKRRLDGKQIEEKKNFLLSVTREGEPSAKVAETLIGAKPNEKRTLTLPLPKQEGAEGASQELFCEFLIHEVKVKQVPPLEDAFAKQVGNFSTLQELESAIREGILKDKEKKIRRETEQKILEQLVKECAFPLPKSLLKREAKREEQRFRLRCRIAGMNPQQEEEAFQKEKPQCETRSMEGLRQALILDRVATLEKIDATVEEIEARLKELAAQWDRKENRSDGDEALREQVQEELRLEKAMEFLVSHAQFQEES